MRSARAWLGVFLGLVAVGGGFWLFAAEPGETELRARAGKAFSAGNFKNAYDDYRRLALDPKASSSEVGNDLYQGMRALQRLARSVEIDAFREAAIKAQAENWHFLATAAKSYVDP